MFFRKSKKSLVKKSVSLIKKSVSIYISEQEKQVIIAPLYHTDPRGVYYEQENCFCIDYPVDNSTLGEEIIRGLNLFKIKYKNFRDQLKSDWPAYKHSRSKTMKAFESAYFRIWVAGLNEYNIILSIEGTLSTDDEITIQSTISSSADKKDIGQRVMKVYRMCTQNVGRDL